MKLARAPASVMAVIARRRSAGSGNHFVSTTNAGSYSTAAITSPIPTQSA